MRDKALRALGRASCDHLLERDAVQQAMRSRFSDESLIRQTRRGRSVWPKVPAAAFLVCSLRRGLTEETKGRGLSRQKATASRLKTTLTDARIPPDARARTLAALVRCAARPSEERTVKDSGRDCIREASVRARIGAGVASLVTARVSQHHGRSVPVKETEYRLDPSDKQVVDVVSAAGDDQTIGAVFAMALTEQEGKSRKAASCTIAGPTARRALGGPPRAAGRVARTGRSRPRRRRTSISCNGFLDRGERARGRP